MVEYLSERLKIKGTNALDVATALAYLGGFSQGTVIKRRTGDHPGTSRTVVVFHKDTVAKDPDLFLATQNPDILVSGFLGDEYVVEANTDRISPSLCGQIEEEIKRAYSTR